MSGDKRRGTLSAEAECSAQTVRQSIGFDEAKTLVAKMEADETWPEGHDAVFTTEDGSVYWLDGDGEKWVARLPDGGV